MTMRRFDPRAVGRYECRAWETYYRRKWAAFLIASVALVRAAFRMSWPKTLYGAWLVLRAKAMDVSDRWIEAGRDPQHPLLREERALLVRSYAALLAAVYR